jgi:hypothetical protein
VKHIYEAVLQVHAIAKSHISKLTDATSSNILAAFARSSSQISFEATKVALAEISKACMDACISIATSVPIVE